MNQLDNISCKLLANVQALHIFKPLCRIIGLELISKPKNKDVEQTLPLWFGLDLDAIVHVWRLLSNTSHAAAAGQSIGHAHVRALTNEYVTNNTKTNA